MWCEMARSPRLLLMLVALLGVWSGRAAADARYKARSALLEELRSAEAHLDVFTKLPKAQRLAWEYADKSLNETLEGFTDVPVDLIITIKLIGFDGDGINRVKLSESDLLKYLRALHMDLQTVVLEPEPTKLSLRPRLHFRVLKASQALTHKVSGVLTSAIFAAQQNNPNARKMPTFYLPHTTLDTVLSEEEESVMAQMGRSAPSGSSAHAWTAHLSSTLHPALTLYVLNLEPPLQADYLYTYMEEEEAVKAGNWSQFHSCPGMLYVNERLPFAWVDLGAAPQSYGPLRGGHGQVFPHSLPHASAYQPALVHTAILPDLAALAASAVQHLAWPPLQHGVPAFQPHRAHKAVAAAAERAEAHQTAEADFDIHVVHMHDTLQPPGRSVNPDMLQEELRRILGSTSVAGVVHEHFVSMAKCDLCVNSYTNALRVRTRRQEGGHVMSTSGQILDRLVLHQSLQEYAEIIMAYAGVYETRRALPVFVFDLSLREEALLLDGNMLAAAFPDMVIAVASRTGGSVSTRFSCGHMPRRERTDEITRHVLAGVLQTAFGVTHPAVRYHPASGVGWQHLWSIGATPFGPLSSLPLCSWAQHGPAVRNLAIVEAERNMGRIANVLRGMLRVSNTRGSWEAAITSADKRKRAQARVNVAAYKMELMTTALAHGHNADALRLAQLLHHDASALERVALQVEARLTKRYECSGGTDWTVLLWPPAGSLLAVAAAALWRFRGARLRAEQRYDKIY